MTAYLLFAIPTSAVAIALLADIIIDAVYYGN